MSRVQIWLEHFLTPLSIYYCKFEYIKDINDFLINIEKIKEKANSDNWNWDDYLLFANDVKALYPSVKFEHLTTALHYCFDMLNQGIPSGGKYSVPLANILLCFILMHAFNINDEFSRLFKLNISLWKRSIDDCSGTYKGSIVKFLHLFNLLQSNFSKYNLELICDTGSHTVCSKLR